MTPAERLDRLVIAARGPRRYRLGRLLWKALTQPPARSFGLELADANRSPSGFDRFMAPGDGDFCRRLTLPTDRRIVAFVAEDR